MIDLHCHILPGVDDGPATAAEALDLARAAAAAGISTIVATPHVSPHYPNDAPTIEAAIGALSEALLASEIQLALVRGAEIAITRLDELAAGELDRLHLGGGPWLLIESPYTAPVDALPGLLARLQADGHRIILAHPERCPGFHRRPALLRELVDQDVLTSVTAGALSGGFGRQVERFCVAMAGAGLVHNVASDAHDLKRRPPGLASHIERAGLAAHAELLTETMPRAILSGAELPPHPGPMLAEASQRQRWWRAVRRA